MLKIIKIVWIILCVLVLFISFYYFDDDPKNDIDIFLILSMLFLSFPSGYVAAAVLKLIAILWVKIWGEPPSNSYLLIIIIWLPYFIVGYIQWFVLTPKLVKWIKKRRKGVTH